MCNCGYVVAPVAQGQGVASLMCEHSQQQAVAMGFRAMQFNLVVASNVRAVRLWQHLGFAIVGTLPGAFRHHTLGYVDAHVRCSRRWWPEPVAHAKRAPKWEPFQSPGSRPATCEATTRDGPRSYIALISPDGILPVRTASAAWACTAARSAVDL